MSAFSTIQLTREDAHRALRNCFNKRKINPWVEAFIEDEDDEYIESILDKIGERYRHNFIIVEEYEPIPEDSLGKAMWHLDNGLPPYMR
ncbi:MAG: hypothetical protein CL489_10565 [Acidobacteria bacterium]|nr:hypothetical protein [Acidobacteriota bacterium]|tara:strand:- start:2558 stop:2824 length:267 start_codon:yes stop_codon:yes gene_type:complete